MMKAFVTGARGAIGREVCAHLGQIGSSITRFSRNADSLHLPLSSLDDHLWEILPDVVLHLAWSTFPATSEMQPGSEWITDLPLLAKVCRAISRIPVASRPHLVFLSTGAIYGDCRGKPHREEDVPCPKGWYARGKLAAEALIGSFASADKVPAVIIRASSVYGFLQEPSRLQGIVPKLIHSAYTGSLCTLWGDGSAKKDFLHVRDLMGLVEQLIKHRVTGTFNACTGLSASLDDISAVVEKVTGRSLAVRHEAAVEWDVHHTSLSRAKAFEAVGWVPSISLGDGISEVAACHLGSLPNNGASHQGNAVIDQHLQQ